MQFLVDNWVGVVLFALALLFLSPLVTFPGGVPKQLWWVCAGTCILADIIIYCCFNYQIAKMEATAGMKSVGNPLPPPMMVPTTRTISRDFSVSAECCIITMGVPGPNTWWVVSKNPKPIAYPVFSQLLIKFRNQSTSDLTIDQYSIKARSVSSNWEEMPIFKGYHDDLYFVNDPSKTAKVSLFMPQYFFREIANKKIVSGESVKGWILLSDGNIGPPKEFSMTIKDSDGNEGTNVIILPLDVTGLVQRPRLEDHFGVKLLEQNVDLNKIPIQTLR